jgi:hypothetical protein
VRTIAAVIILVASACGSDDPVDLSGMYEVTYHTQSDSDCDSEGQAVTDPPYFLLEKQEIFGIPAFSYAACDDSSAASCSGGGVLFGLSFQQPIDDGWRGEVSGASGTGAPCNLWHGKSSAILTDVGVRIVTRTWGEETTVAEELCGYELAEQRNESMPCQDHQVIEGTLVDMP